MMSDPQRWDDLPYVETEISIEALPEDVWRFVTDLEKWGTWSPEFQGGEWGPAGPVAGGTFVGRNARGERRWETTSLITEAESGRVFAWAVQTEDGLPGSTWRIEIEPADSGVTVKHSVQLGPGPSGLTAAIEKYPEDAEEIKARRAEAVREGMEAVLAGLKTAAES